MKKSLLLLISLLVNFIGISRSFAVPAYPRKVVVSDANGNPVEIFMRGDEHLKYAQTTDGYTLLSDTKGWWYASLVDSNTVIKSDYMLMSKEDETDELRKFKLECPKGIVPKHKLKPETYRTQGVRVVRSNNPVLGERRALVIMMQYRDLVFKKTREDFEALFNQIGYNENGATGSVRDFYKFASQSQLDYVSDVYGPFTAQNPMSYYGANRANGGDDMRPLELCIEAVNNLPSDIDYSVYDNDGDGLVDNVHIIFAGYGEEAGASSDAIWAHEYPHRINLKNEIGFSLAGYSCSPELRGNRGTGISNIGVVCHELGHALGAMDYYDTNYGTGGEYLGTGNWDIMAGGSWNDDGRTPPNFNPYVRSTVFGWNNQVVLGADQRISMSQMDINNPKQTVVYRMNTGSNDDYFLLENRQQNGFDAAIPGAGLIVYHVHPYIDRYNNTNTVNATHPQGLYPVCASYSEPSKKKYGNINSGECPFPGSKMVTSFSPDTSPAAVAWNGSAAQVSISNITMNVSDGSVSFTTGDEIIDEPENPDLPIEKELIYHESFETSISGQMAITSIAGKETWRTYAKGDFVMNADYIPQATDGRKILMLFSGKGNLLNESEVISPDIEVEPGSNYTISFNIYCEANPASDIPSFNLFVEDEYGEYDIFNLKEATKQWKSVELPLTFAGDVFRYKLNGKVYMGGVFVDNLRLYKEEDATSIDGVPKSSDMSVDIYRLDGGHLNDKDIATLPAGIYIIRQGKETRKIIVK